MPKTPMNENLEYAKLFARFPLRLKQFLRRHLTVEDARRTVRERMAHRPENFLRVVERNIYANPSSPYLKLLKHAGCEFGDLRASAAQKGVEGTLRELREEGVYVTYEEFKGRKPILRNGLTLAVRASDFDNPYAERDIRTESSGSTGLGLAVNQNLEHIAKTAAYHLLLEDVHGLRELPCASWMSFFPGSGLGAAIRRELMGHPLQRWFIPSGWRDSKYWFKYDLAALYMFAWLRVYGARTPFPQVVKPEQAIIIARWMHNTLKTHGRCVLFTGVSRGLRVCLAAERAGLDLKGAVMRVGAEPVTPAKIEVIQRVGVRLISGYGMVEASPLTIACANSPDADDVHLIQDAYALLTHPYEVESAGITVPAFNLTALLDTAPKVLFNYQADDYGLVQERSCGCALESYGYTTHISQVRSYSKLVGEGVTLIGNEIERILEEQLPARFGGSPLDYQFLEEEDEQGFTRLYLLISPQLGVIDEPHVLEFLHNALRESSPMADAARTVWQNTQTIRIKRQEPFSNARGKVLPLHVKRHVVQSS